MKLIRAILITAVACSAVAVSSLATSSVATAQTKPKRINLKPILDKLWVLQGDGGHHVILVPPWERRSIRAMKLKPALDGVMFFGSKGKYYSMPIRGASANGTKKFSKYFVDNRMPKGGTLEYNQGVTKLTCGKRVTKLKLVEGNRRRSILRNSKFYGRLWRRQAVALARNSFGLYYYVDRLTKAAGGQGFRLFRGVKGRLKRVPLVDVAQDSVGFVFAARKGALVLTRGVRTRRFAPSKFTVKWVTRKGNKTSMLKFIPPLRNTVVIYKELGVYTGNMGTPCDVY